MEMQIFLSKCSCGVSGYSQMGVYTDLMPALSWIANLGTSNYKGHSWVGVLSTQKLRDGGTEVLVCTLQEADWHIHMRWFGEESSKLKVFTPHCTFWGSYHYYSTVI